VPWPSRSPAVRPIAVVNASAPLGGVELSMLTVLRRGARESRVVAGCLATGRPRSAFSVLGIE
jgi:hypothetical protein